MLTCFVILLQCMSEGFQEYAGVSGSFRSVGMGLIHRNRLCSPYELTQNLLLCVGHAPFGCIPLEKPLFLVLSSLFSAFGAGSFQPLLSGSVSDVVQPESYLGRKHEFP